MRKKKKKRGTTKVPLVLKGLLSVEVVQVTNVNKHTYQSRWAGCTPFTMVANNTGTCVPVSESRWSRPGQWRQRFWLWFPGNFLQHKRVKDDAEVRKRLWISPLEFVGLIPAVSFIFIRTKAPAWLGEYIFPWASTQASPLDARTIL